MAAVNTVTKSLACWGSSCLKQGLADHPADKRRRNRPWPNGRALAFKSKPQSELSCGIRKHRHQNVGLLALCMPQTGTDGSSVGRKEKESALAKSPRDGLKKQAAIGAVARAHRVLVNAPLEARSVPPGFD
jgi:hypothetical protein